MKEDDLTVRILGTIATVEDNNEKMLNELKVMRSELDNSIKNYAVNVAFKDSRYLFISNVSGIKRGYCTHCRTVHYTEEKIKHKEKVKCKQCKSVVEVRFERYSRKYMINRRYILHYTKTKKKGVIAAVGILASMDFSGAYTEIEIQYKVKDMWIFDTNKNRAYQYEILNGTARKKKTINSMLGKYMYSGMYENYYTNEKSLGTAIKNTRLEYFDFNANYIGYNRIQTGIEAVAEVTKRPILERVQKLGFEDVVYDHICQRNKIGHILNLKANTVEGLFKLKKFTIKKLVELEKNKGEFEKVVTARMISNIQDMENKRGIDLTSLTAKEINTLHAIITTRVTDMSEYVSETNSLKIMRYLGKQEEIEQQRMVNDWIDYIAECEKLQYDLKKKEIFFPKNLRKAHAKTTKRVNYTENVEMNTKIKSRQEKLKACRFVYNGIETVIPESAGEMIVEGRELNHCVGGYAERHANGETTIIFIRKSDAADESFYTMEIRDGEIIQVRGKRNCGPTEEVKKFLDAFKKNMRNKNKKEQKWMIA